MHKGDRVIADHPERDTGWLIRTYGVVAEITTTGRVMIKLADGSVISRNEHSVAVYLKSPKNWQELFEMQEVVFNHPTKPVLSSSLRAPSPNN